MDVLLSDLPKVHLKGKTDEKSYEVKTPLGEILMTGTCHYTPCGGWPEERFTMKQANGSLALVLKGDAAGDCCSCGGSSLNTEVCTASGSILGVLKGSPSNVILATTSNDVLGEIKSTGIFSSDKKIQVRYKEGKMAYEGHFSCNKYLVTFPDNCPANIKVLIVAGGIEILWKDIQDRNSS